MTHATSKRVDTVAAFIWNAYRRPHFPGMPEWKDASPIQRMACEDDAHAILSALDALDARRSTDAALVAAVLARWGVAPEGNPDWVFHAELAVDAIGDALDARRPTETPDALAFDPVSTHPAGSELAVWREVKRSTETPRQPHLPETREDA